MTKTRAADSHAKGKQQGEPLCEHPIQELVCLAHSNDGGLMGIYHCRKCGEAIIYVDMSSPFFQIFARHIFLVKTGMRTMLFGQLPRGLMPLYRFPEAGFR